ncbi:MAG: caspase family protein [bacterium]
MGRRFWCVLVVSLGLGQPALAQQKFEYVKKERWRSNAWVNLVSLSALGGKRDGFKLDMLGARYKYIRFTLVSVLSNKASDIFDFPKEGVDYDFFDGEEPPNNILYILPVGFYLPVLTLKSSTFGLNSNLYLFPSKENRDEEEFPRLVELGVRFDMRFFSLQLGRRWQFDEWLRPRFDFFGNHFVRSVVEHDRFDGYFFEASVGLMGPLNTRTSVEHKKMLPNPSLFIATEGVQEEVLSGEGAELEVTIGNRGKGAAEIAYLNVHTVTGRRDVLTFDNEYYVGDLPPDARRTVRIPIAATSDLQDEELLTLRLVCTEKDGFRAQADVDLRVVPESRPEKFPPVLSGVANLRESNGNNLLDANELGGIEVAVLNNGKGNAWNVRVALEPLDMPPLPGLSVRRTSQTIRKIPPGATETVSFPLTADMDIPSGTVKYRITIREGNGFDAVPIVFSFGTQGFIAPQLAVVDVGIDDTEGPSSFGNGNNIIENNETVEVTVVLQNRGQGIAENVVARIVVASDNIFYSGEELYKLRDLNAGQSTMIRFPFVVNNRYAGDALLPISILVSESWGKYGFTQSLGLELNKVFRDARMIEVTGQRHETVAIPDAASAGVDVDLDIPFNKSRNSDAVAVVIGISKYQNRDVPPVLFGKRDALVMKRYLINILGFDQKRIIEIYDHDASLASFKRIFEQQLPNWIRKGKSDVFVYYSGHGAPDPESEEAFFVPYDCDPSYARSTGYKVKEFYARLADLQARSVTAVVDACFSGSTDAGMLLKGISPLFIKVENPVALLENGVVFTSSTGQQVATWFHEKKHGLFTYFFLKGLRGEADGDSNAEITAAEMETFLLNHVPDTARYLNNREQTPQVMTKDKARVLVKFSTPEDVASDSN